MKGKILLIIVASLLIAACSTQPEITSYEECVAAGNPVMESYPEKCSDGENTFTNNVEPQPTPPEQQACTRDYNPVCGEVEIQCITTPCNPIQTTFSNACEAENAGAEILYEGECIEEVNPQGACLSFDGNWLEDSQECEGMAQTQCESLGGTYNECASACRNNPDAQICTLQCIQVCSFN